MRTFSKIHEFFLQKGFTPFAFQQEAWECCERREEFLIQCPTGSGKTLAATGWMLNRLLSDEGLKGLRLLYITPLRAMTRDIEAALAEPLNGTSHRVVARNSDTSAKDRASILKNPPQILMTTPESLSVLLASTRALMLFNNLELVVVDEWHELLGSKRGTQTQLCLARLRLISAQLRTIGVSATVENPAFAVRCLLSRDAKSKIISANLKREIRLQIIQDEDQSRLPWAGHLGLNLLRPVAKNLDINSTSILFTNTRNQAEQWYHALSIVRTDLKIALHHGSLAKENREEVEFALKHGTIDLVIATSALDLGVDFHAVERIIQIGSPRTVSRLIQRSGRANHKPGQSSEVLLVPTNRLHLNEYQALATALDDHAIEPVRPPFECLDVLMQHLITLALQSPWTADEVYSEITSVFAYSALSRQTFDRVIVILVKGSEALNEYPEFNRLLQLDDGRFTISGMRFARRHRMSIGTIVSNTSVKVKMRRGQSLGEIEEVFAGRLRPGDAFRFAGKRLEVIRLLDGELIVKPVVSKQMSEVPRWTGGRLPLSDTLASRVINQFEGNSPISKRITNQGWLIGAIEQTRAIQNRLSECPNQTKTLIERFKSRDGYHLIIYPFAGWLVHQGLGPLLAYRIGRHVSATITITVNDYGIEFLSASTDPFAHLLSCWKALTTPINLDQDLDNALNLTELAKRQFRATARIAGLIFEGYPGQSKSLRALQTSAGLLFEVLKAYDAEHLLLKQAKIDVLENEFDRPRLQKTLLRIQKNKLHIVDIKQPSPLALPLVIDRLSARLSSETVAERMRKMTESFDA